MAELTPADSLRPSVVPRPPVPIWSRRIVGFPAGLPPLIGREREVAALRDLLCQPELHLITVTGPGGVGKTRLALAVATEIEAGFPDGAAFVPLAAVGDPALVLPAIARALDIRESLERPLVDALVAALRERRLLLVLDNFEHVLPAAADVAHLLESCSRLTVLVTSRAPLRLSGEQRYLTPPLALPAPDDNPEVETLPDFGAIRLFVERARAADHEFALDGGNAAAIVAICRRLDGLPLAIELAAAWVNVLPPAALLERLERRLLLLHGRAADQPDRLRTMRDAIAWSYDLLSEEEAQLFRRLAVFVGGFTLDAVEWVMGRGSLGSVTGPAMASRDTRHLPPDTTNTLDLLAGLVDKSVLRRTGEGAASRFTMLETIREYGLERLAANGEERIAHDALARWCLDFAERSAPDLWRDDDVVVRAKAIAAEHANLLVALSHLAAIAADEKQVRLAASLGPFWGLGSELSVGRACLERALARRTSLPAVEAVALARFAWLATFQGDHSAAAAALERAEERATVSSDPLALALVRTQQAALAVFQGDYAAAQARSTEAEALARSGHAPLAAAFARFIHARAVHYGGDLERAEALYRELLADPPPPRYAAATYRLSLAMIARIRRQHKEALSLYAASIQLFRDIGEHWSAATSLEGVSEALGGLGQAETAARLMGAAAALRSTIGVPIPPADRAHYERAFATVRVDLGPEAFDAAWTAGLALSFDEAIAEATALARLVTSPGSDLPATASDVGTWTAAMGLTARERDVLRHLIAGLSDKEIAAALGIGRRTVSNHVSVILGKLQAPSRTAAATIALRDHLV